MYMVYYLSGNTWYPLEQFKAKDEAREYIKYETERDEYMTKTTGYNHVVEYKIEEV